MRSALILSICIFLGACLVVSADDRKEDRDGRKKKRPEVKKVESKPAEAPADKTDAKPADADAKAADAKADPKAAKVSFKTDISPLLKDACSSCHSGAKRKAGLDVTSYDSLMRFVKAGDADASKLHKSLLGKGAKLMPPKNPLSEEQIAMVKAWIAAGAKKD